MNIIMSRAAHHFHPSRGVSPMQQHPSRHSKPTLPISSPCNPGSPTSPLDFTNGIPFNELRLSSETLGLGSFGTVFKGRWRGRNVAVKQFKTREEIDSFLVEVKQLSCVKHTNIVTLYGATTLSDTAYLVMEYAEGGSLNHLLHECKQQEYDLRHACSWAMQTARGVAYLHSIRPKPIMHRDLKPANLLLFSRGKILKICDFGTACAVKTKMTNNTGSALYMAPEVFATDSYLESGDVFSWGIIFWEILVRCQPYNQKYSNPYQILWSVNQGARPLEIEGCPKPIWYLITRSWNKDPTQRPSMHQVAKEIEFIFSLTTSSSRKPDKPANVCVARPESPGASSNQSSRHSRPSLPSINSPIESKLSAINRMSSLSAASTSTSTSSALVSKHYHQHHYQNQPFSEHHYQQYRQQLSRQEELSISSQAAKSIRMKALRYHVEQLQRRSEQLESDLKCDKKNTASVSFQEFDSLKRRIKTMRQLMRESENRQACAGSTRDSSCDARPSSPPEEARDALQASSEKP